MNLGDLLLGRPLATEDETAQRIGPVKGIPIFGLDALSSAAYGPEAALTLLIPLGMAGITYILPISISIVVLLGIVYFSYRQTIEAYPQGGGSYTVASENLGVWAGLLAAASLMVDYVLTCGSRNFRRSGRTCFSRPFFATAYVNHVSGNLDSSYACESARSAGDRRNISNPNVLVHSLFGWNDRNRCRQGDRRRGPSSPRSDATKIDARDSRRGSMASDARLREWLYSHDRSRSSK